MIWKAIMIDDGIINSKKIQEYIISQRWFQNKNDKIIEFRINDAISYKNIIFFVLDALTSNGKYMYYFPVILDETSNIIDTVDGHTVCDAAFSENYAASLARFFESGIEIKGMAGSIKFVPTEFYRPIGRGGFSPIRSEQSNSSLIIGDMIIKNYRYLQFGDNPDIKMALALKQNGFPNVPLPEAYCLYSTVKGSIYIISASEFIKGSSDLWTVMAKKISEICSKDVQYQKKVDEIMDYSGSISKKLGNLTGEMHRALYSAKEEDFYPEMANLNDFQAILDETASNLSESGMVKNDLIERTKNIFEYKILRLNLSNATKFRIHGDYHLGQILASDRLYVIDFEGEPMRSLSQRSAKQFPLRDVAGMVRSLSYLLHYSGTYLEKNDLESIYENSKGIFLSCYKEAIKDFGIVPESIFSIMDLFLLQKASYELLYEIKNRPSWANIPLNEIIAIYDRIKDPENK